MHDLDITPRKKLGKKNMLKILLLSLRCGKPNKREGQLKIEDWASAVGDQKKLENVKIEKEATTS